jgi:hypothetical protein
MLQTAAHWKIVGSAPLSVHFHLKKQGIVGPFLDQDCTFASRRVMRIDGATD